MRWLYCARCAVSVPLTGWKRVGCGGIVGATKQHAEVVIYRHRVCEQFSVVLKRPKEVPLTSEERDHLRAQFEREFKDNPHKVMELHAR